MATTTLIDRLLLEKKMQKQIFQKRRSKEQEMDHLTEKVEEESSLATHQHVFSPLDYTEFFDQETEIVLQQEHVCVFFHCESTGN